MATGIDHEPLLLSILCSNEMEFSCGFAKRLTVGELKEAISSRSGIPCQCLQLTLLGEAGNFSALDSYHCCKIRQCMMTNWLIMVCFLVLTLAFLTWLDLASCQLALRTKGLPKCVTYKSLITFGSASLLSILNMAWTFEIYSASTRNETLNCLSNTPVDTFSCQIS